MMCAGRTGLAQRIWPARAVGFLSVCSVLVAYWCCALQGFPMGERQVSCCGSSAVLAEAPGGPDAAVSEDAGAGATRMSSND